MKKLLFCLGLISLSSFGDVLPPPPATPAEVGAGLVKNKYISPYTLSQAGIGSPTNGITAIQAEAIARGSDASGTNTFAGNGLGVTNVVAGGQLTNVGGYKRYNVKTYGATGDGSTDDAAAIQAAANVAAATSAAALGQLFFPTGNYLIESGVLLNGTAGPTIPGTSFDSGWYQVLGQGSRIVAEGNTNALETVNGTRGLSISEMVLVGTNVNRSPVGTHVGFAFNGPQGQMSAENLMTAQFTAGYLLKDITGFIGQNLMSISNFVGVAVNFKPDNVNLHIRSQYDYYGVFLNYTNTQFTNYTDAGGPTISGVIGYCTKGIVIPKGSAILRDVYFEGNGRSIQLGLEDANTYEASYPGTEASPSGVAPNVTVEGFEGTTQDIYVYRNSTLKFNSTITFASSVVRLENASADASTIESDLVLGVRKSDSSVITIGNGYRYVNGARVPISGMSSTNLTDFTVGDYYSSTNVTANTNWFIVSGCDTNALNGNWFWNASDAAYTNSSATGYEIYFTSVNPTTKLNVAVIEAPAGFIYSSAINAESGYTSGGWFNENIEETDAGMLSKFAFAMQTPEQVYANGINITNVASLRMTTNSVAVTPNISLYITNSDGAVYRLSAQKL